MRVHDSEQVAERLHLIALHVMRGLRREDDALGVGPARLSALSVLLSGPKTITELAAAEQVRLPTITRVVAGLERLGLARRTPHPRDGRSVQIEMTDEGAAMIARGRRARVRRLRRALDQLDVTDLDGVVEALDALERVSAKVLRDG